MNNFRLLTNDEALEVAKSLWASENMQKYLVDTYDFYTTKDGLIIELTKVKKLTIDKTMYYDDEQEAPETTENNFIIYNRYNVPEHNLNDYLEEKERLLTMGCATGRYDYNGIYFRLNYTNNDKIVNCNWSDDKDQYFKRYLTEDEQNEYIELVKERQAQYQERLKKYYKRYGKNITTHGYWANR